MSTFWIVILIHLAGWLYFTPYMARSISRGTVPHCPKGNSDEHCTKYHADDCRMERGLKSNLEYADFFYGTLGAFFWEITAFVTWMYRRATKPDEIQKVVTERKDAESVTELAQYQARQARAAKLQLQASVAKELEAKKVHDVEIVVGDETVTGQVETMDFREIQAALDHDRKMSDADEVGWNESANYKKNRPHWIAEQVYE